MIGIFFLPMLVEDWIEDFWRTESAQRHLPMVRRIVYVGILITTTLAAFFCYYTMSDRNIVLIFTGAGIRFATLGLGASILTRTPSKEPTPEEAREASLRSSIKTKQSVIRDAERIIAEQQAIIARTEDDIRGLERELEQYSEQSTAVQTDPADPQ